MKLQIRFLKYFYRRLKPFLKKHPNLKLDLLLALKAFDERRCVCLGGKVYKMRFKSSDYPRGKSGSFRVIVHFSKVEYILTPVCIYAKSNRESLAKAEITYHVGQILLELRHGDTK